MKKKHNSMSSDRGYSLIELVVTILMSSVVMIAVVGFLTAGLRHYRNVNSETLLQMEAQVTDLFLTELFQEAQDFRVMDSSVYPTGISYAVEVKRDGTTYALALNEGELWIAEVTAGNDAGNLLELQSKGRAGAFLAQYVDSMQIASGTFSEAVNSWNSLVNVRVAFKADTKTYNSDILVSLRNGKRN